MVQGETGLFNKSLNAMDDNSSRKAGFEAMKKREAEEIRKAEEKRKYGAWGSTFKNKDHFINMHYC